MKVFTFLKSVYIFWADSVYIQILLASWTSDRYLEIFLLKKKKLPYVALSWSLNLIANTFIKGSFPPIFSGSAQRHHRYYVVIFYSIYICYFRYRSCWKSSNYDISENWFRFCLRFWSDNSQLLNNLEFLLMNIKIFLVSSFFMCRYLIVNTCVCFF